MITRAITGELLESAGEYPVVTVLGPRQSGKTTLVRMTFPDKPYYSLENPDTRLMAETDPRGFLGGLPEGAILDEVQRAPDLLSYIQGIVDEVGGKGMFILTGSHQPDVHQAVSQTLAGRTAILTLLPFAVSELAGYGRKYTTFPLLVQGFYPRLHEEGLKCSRYYNSYIQTFVERDVRSLINVKDLSQFQNFLILLAGRVGQVVNYTSLGNDIGLSATSVKNWLSILKASFLIFELPPYFENISKRVIKSPKLYFTDTGLASHLLGIETAAQAERDPLRGGLYENFVILEILKSLYNRGVQPKVYFYRDTHGNEVDFLLLRQRRLLPIEIKSSATFTKSFLKGVERFQRVVGSDRCDNGYVLYNGADEFTLKSVTIRNIMHHGLPELLPD